MARGWALIEKARRLLQGERGAMVKDWGGRLPVALVYPSPYFVGMSSLGFQTVYGLLNGFDDVACERAFLNLGRDADDLETISIESQRPLQDFPVIGFSLSYELDYPNVIRILRDAGIPPLAEERRGLPLVIAGGPAVSANPLPLAPFVDAVLVGELEEAAGDLVRGLAAAAEDGDMAPLADIAGVYCPTVHRERGSVRRVWAQRLDEWRTATVVATPFTEFGGMHLVEVARGCMRSCRFCLAGHMYRPVRERSADLVLEMAREGTALGRTIGLLAPSISDARGFRRILSALVGEGARVSAPSLRADTLDDELMRELVLAGNDALTIAPEAGCARLRRLIGKDMDTATVLDVAARAEGHGFSELKLYFMVGLPTETEDDVREAAELVRQVRARFPRRLVATVACFIPKANTPFQWQGMMPVRDLQARLALFTAELRGTGVAVRSESPPWALIQAVLARGDERVGLALAGATSFTRSGLMRAFRQAGVDAVEVAGPRQMGQDLPWDVIAAGLPPGYLERRGAVSGEDV